MRDNFRIFADDACDIIVGPFITFASNSVRWCFVSEHRELRRRKERRRHFITGSFRLEINRLTPEESMQRHTVSFESLRTTWLRVSRTNQRVPTRSIVEYSRCGHRKDGTNRSYRVLARNYIYFMRVLSKDYLIYIQSYFL